MVTQEPKVVDADKIRAIEEQLTLSRQTLRSAALALCQAEDAAQSMDCTARASPLGTLITVSGCVP